MDILSLVQKRPELSPDASVSDAVRCMCDRQIGGVAVTDGGRLAGIFTERDLMTKVIAAGKAPATTKVREVMTSPVHAANKSMSVTEAATIMRQHHLRHLPVIDEDGDLLGMVTLRQLLYAVLDGLESKVSDLQGVIMTDGPGG